MGRARERKGSPTRDTRYRNQLSIYRISLPNCCTACVRCVPRANADAKDDTVARSARRPSEVPDRSALILVTAISFAQFPRAARDEKRRNAITVWRCFEVRKRFDDAVLLESCIYRAAHNEISRVKVDSPANDINGVGDVRTQKRPNNIRPYIRAITPITSAWNSNRRFQNRLTTAMTRNYIAINARNVFCDGNTVNYIWLRNIFCTRLIIFQFQRRDRCANTRAV